jgi:hypothetical protein
MNEEGACVVVASIVCGHRPRECRWVSAWALSTVMWVGMTRTPNESLRENFILNPDGIVL